MGNCQQSGRVCRDLVFSEALLDYHPYLPVPFVVLTVSNPLLTVLPEPHFLAASL